MSGYLEVKYPFRSNLGLNPFKAWKRQWCILRPSPICVGGGSLAFYCNEAGAAVGSVDIPIGSIVKKAKSRTRPNAFAVYLADEPRKPKILLAAQSVIEAQNWMDKIKTLLDGTKHLDTLLKDSYSVTILDSELSRKVSLNDVDCTLAITLMGLVITKQTQQLGTLVLWKHIREASLEDCDNNKICVICLNSTYMGGGVMNVSSPWAATLVRRIGQSVSSCTARRYISRSDGDLANSRRTRQDAGRPKSWYSRLPSITVDDSVLPVSKVDAGRPKSWYSRLPSITVDDSVLPVSKDVNFQKSHHSLAAPSCAPAPPNSNVSIMNNSISSLRSVASVASGIYEEIPDMPPAAPSQDPQLTATIRKEALSLLASEPTYESVSECVYATRYPPPLPPRAPFSNLKLGESWNSRLNQIPVSRHNSLSSLPHSCTLPASYKTLPKDKKTFTMFRKRLKSDTTPLKRDPTKDNDENKKKKFDFTQSGVFRNFRVGKKMKNTKTNSLNRVTETKSCEFLDETVVSSRCSKSVDCLDVTDELDCTDLSLESNDEVIASLTLPQEILDLILKTRQQTEVQAVEDDYMPMSPIIPPAPIENNYIVMSPRTKIV